MTETWRDRQAKAAAAEIAKTAAAVCKGSWVLGSACGRCSRCFDSAPEAARIIRDLIFRHQVAEAPARAVEFGGYLATSADRYMACVNSYESAKEGSDETVEDATLAMTEAYRRLQSDVYEFRKRVAAMERVGSRA